MNAPAGPGLREETNELRAALAACRQENTLLTQLLGTMLSTVNVDQLLGQIIAHLQVTVPCHAVFIYLWEPAQERLVMRGASASYAAHVGRIALRIGEGLVGWSAQTGLPVMVREQALDDPRFRYFPELHEEQFQAVLTVPMSGPPGAIEAVIIMHTVAPQEFTEEHVRLVSAMAPMLGGAIAASRLRERTLRTLAVLSRLSTLLQGVHSRGLLEAALPPLAETTLQVTASTLCVVATATLGLDRCSLGAYSLEGEGVTCLYAGQLDRLPWDVLARHLTAGVNPLPELPLPPGLTSLVVPIVSAGEQLGVLACYRQAGRAYTEDDRSLLTIIASQAAIAAKNSQLADLLVEHDVPARLFRDLQHGSEEDADVVRRRAALLGCDLSHANLPLIVEVEVDAARRVVTHQRLAVALGRWLDEQYPGSLVHVEHEVLALVHVEGRQAAASTLLSDVGQLARGALDLLPRGGAGGICRTVAAYRRGFAEAREALRVMRAQPGGGMARFEDLGATRYLVSLAQAAPPPHEIRDRYEESVLRLAEHDERKNTDLLKTLEIFLHCGGSVARAADPLYVHRNTMLQRLEKMQEVLDVDPRESEHWLALQIAIKLWQLQPPHA